MFANPSRRMFLRFSLSTALGLSGLRGMSSIANAKPDAERRFKPVIILFLSGGPSRQETFDPCHPDALAEYRGEFKRIETSIKGAHYSEHWPLLAARADKCAILRGLDSESGDHFESAKRLFLGAETATLGLRWGERAANGGPPYMFIQTPSFYSPMDALQPTRAMVSKWQRSRGLMGTFSAEWERDLAAPGQFVGPEIRRDPRLDERAKLLSAFDTTKIESPAVIRRDANYHLAMDLLSGGGGTFFEAFTPSKAEQDDYRKDLERYGDTVVGKATLLARRLVERGAGFVVVYNERGMGWDMHSNLFKSLPALAAETDKAAAVLIDDMQRGIMRDCLLVILGEFGRTPKVNASAGRDHWGEGYPAIFCGHKVKAGIVHGRTHHTGRITDGRVSASQFGPTLMHLAGGEELINPATQRVREIIASG